MALTVAPQVTPTLKVSVPLAALTTPTSTPQSDLTDEPVAAISDADMWRAIMTGATFGTVGVFLLAFVMCLAAGIGVGNAAGVSLLPAFFGGVYAGGAPTLLSKMLRFEKDARRI